MLIILDTRQPSDVNPKIFLAILRKIYNLISKVGIPIYCNHAAICFYELFISIFDIRDGFGCLLALQQNIPGVPKRSALV